MAVLTVRRSSSSGVRLRSIYYLLIPIQTTLSYPPLQSALIDTICRLQQATSRCFMRYLVARRLIRQLRSLGNLLCYLFMAALVRPTATRTFSLNTVIITRWFAEREYPVYSLSLRGHGQSWYPSYRALYFTPKHVLADDVATALRFIRKQHPSAGPTTLVGHSSGGGLCQHVIDSGKGEGVGKLVVLAGIPSFGGWRVYLNWFMLDPWFPIRVLWDLYHPRSPLSSTRLVHRAFFSPTYSIEKVRTFEAEMSPYESMSWPSGMMFPFISRKRLLTNLIAYNTHAPLLTIGGAQDKLVSVPIMRRLAYLYADTSVRTHAGATTAEKKLGCKDVSGLQDGLTSGVNRTSEEKKKERGKVWFAKIEEPGAGHNLMRDDGWERCVRVIEAFVNE
ncbi:unnamed protein product [Rhizoctonia solani]|uniref:AB hydrolase-1 domain-containing protein n=1 Tax=Rhizoctonia solani TaxID=456999 RepID=A0A8H3GGE5_9AGAM|nr:unnamed protein product [Rhizoctonia solani]CAE6479958.1 unnamed protein product [Rhizoctonia solani]